MNALVSVIIPVYNVEKYIAKCIESILAQTYSDFELILVDDGSTDDSLSVCNSYKAKDSRIKVITQKNSGVSAARNVGLDSSCGEYICFVDSDDYVTDDYIETMLNTMISDNSIDIVTTNQYRIWDDGRTEIIMNNENNKDISILSGIQTLNDMLYGKTCFATCCCKLYKRSIFENIRFPQYNMGEDAFTLYDCFLTAEKVAHLSKPCYYYYQHQNSAMHDSNFDKFYDYILLSDAFMNKIKVTNKELVPAARNRLIENNFWVYMKMRTNPARYKNQLKHIERNIIKYRKYALLDNNIKIRTRMACLLSYGGMRFLNIIYDNINKSN